jgi:hypothetical protein
MKIVLGGSRFLEKIPQNLIDLLQEWNESGFEFLVGDAPGADSAFQKSLKNIGSKSVTVYSSAGYVRNNHGNWISKEIESGLQSKSNAIHAFKDRYMTSIADTGLMLWDCESAGTLSNVIDLVESGKSCRIWVATDAELYNFDNKPSLEKWLKQYPGVTAEAFKRLSTFRRREAKRNKSGQPALFD